MELSKLARPHALRSTNNISKALSKNIFGVFLGFCDLNTLLELTKLDRKIKIVIEDKRVMPIFTEYIEERETSNLMETLADVILYDEEEYVTSYITELRRILAKKYSRTQVCDFVTEITNSLLNKFTDHGKLNLVGPYLGDPVYLTNIWQALKANKRITVLELTFNLLGTHLLEVLKVNSTIKELFFCSNSLRKDPENLKILCEALETNKTISRLYFDSNKLGEDPENLRNLFEVLKRNKTITILSFRDNSLGEYPDNIANLIEVLKVNNTITYLDLGKNSLGKDPDNLKNLIEVLKVNKTITELDISGNLLGNDPNILKNLIEVLKVNNTITELDISCNDLKDKDDKDLDNLLLIRDDLNIIF